MHLVIVTEELATSNHPAYGLASFSANLARIFRKNDHKVTIVLVTTKKEDILFDEDIALKYAYVEKILWDKFDDIGKMVSVLTDENHDEARRFLVNLHKAELVKKMIDEIKAEEDIDIIHACNVCSLSLGFGYDIPYVVRISSFQNMWDGMELPEAITEYKQNPVSIKDKLEIFTLKKARYIMSPSNLMASIVKEHMGMDATIIESPFSLNKENWNYDVYNVFKGKRYIIHYGRLGYVKGTHIVAEIAKPLLERYPEFVILLAGDYLEMLDDQGERYPAYEVVQKRAGKYAERVIYVGRLVREELYPLIQNAELCLLPSRIENLSNACIEAMAMGKIVVATDGASFEQLIDDRVSGFLCERDNPESFLQAVEEALNMEKEKKQDMIENAFKRIQQLSPKVIYEKFLKYYEKVMHEWEYY